MTKIAYKGFDSNLKCRNVQFEIGKEYFKEYSGELKTCTDKGFHYCNKLDDVFAYYSTSKESRYCEIEILGDFKDNGDKSITNHFRIVKEITQDVYKNILDDKFNLELLRNLQKEYPQFHVGGSTALYLYGIRLKRGLKGGAVDLDLVTPYYIKVESTDDLKIEPINSKPSGNDFDECFLCNNVKVDFKVDPHQRYEYVEYDGHRYKVSTLETIMAAKFRYALNRPNKHFEDVREICGVKSCK